MQLNIYILITVQLLVSLLFAGQETDKTIVTPHLGIKLSLNRNIIYSASFHQAWKKLQYDILGGDVKTETPVALADILNKTSSTELSDEDSFSACGFSGNGIGMHIATSMRNKFNTTVDLSQYSDDPFNIICYSYFRKALTFDTKFETIADPQPFYYQGKSSLVNFFGIWDASNSSNHEGIRRQVEILYHMDNDNFIISLSNEKSTDELLLVISSEFTPTTALGNAITKCLDKVSDSKRERLVDNDRLLIPRIEFAATQEYSELYGVHLANEGFKDYFFCKAIHEIGFKLNEGGAFADSESKIILTKGPGPRSMIINKPFLLIMKEKSSGIPYLAAWIVNPNPLVKAEQI